MIDKTRSRALLAWFYMHTHILSYRKLTPSPEMLRLTARGSVWTLSLYVSADALDQPAINRLQMTVAAGGLKYEDPESMKKKIKKSKKAPAQGPGAADPDIKI